MSALPSLFRVAASNGVVALKPTHGLLSRDGIIPLALSFDTGGPLARSVYDVAAVLGVMTGVDAKDAATQASQGKADTDYTKFLKADALKGARIGVARDFLGADADVDWVMETSFDAMRRAGATLVDVRYPKWILDSKEDFYTTVRWREFGPQVKDYLGTLGPKYPKNLDDLIARARAFTSTRADGAQPNPARWALFVREAVEDRLRRLRG